MSTNPPPQADSRLVRICEALLFAAGRTVTLAELAEAAGEPEEGVLAALDGLSHRLAESGLQLLRLAGGYRLATRPEYAEAVRRLLQPPAQRLTSARLETLAVVAWRQPCTRAEVEAVRGVDCSATLRTLIDLGLVELRGRRRDRPGQPLQYGTTTRFLEEFGLASIADLPSLEELDS